MKKLITIVGIIYLSINISHAQKTAEFGFGGGVVNYVGDLGNEKQFPVSSANAGFQVTIRNFLNNPEKSRTLYKPFTMEMRFSYQRLQYDETNAIGNNAGNELRNYLRGIGFRNDLIGFSTHASYTFYKNKNRPLYKQKFAYFLFAGVGVFYGKPKADLFNGEVEMKNRYFFWADGTVRDSPQLNSQSTGNVIGKDGVYETNLNEWMTEGQGYNKEVHRKKPYDYCNVGFPMGFGVRYGFKKNITISAEVSYYYFLTDYLDDVSGRYATYDELTSTFPNDAVKQELAKYISDPSGRGTNGFVGVITSPRGNPGKPDSYTFINFEISYKFQLTGRSVYGTVAKN